ncbi:hypothetical protein H5410_040648 [Solanum commersonii]|uniref:Uncharacterized protein n=1 Tax=Solanum commersonii TaxID=4109 RepID=A0A9J5XT57_SOLCO|nr:hypothetical protein H5410_040648 [Solanum commersonii]
MVGLLWTLDHSAGRGWLPWHGTEGDPPGEVTVPQTLQAPKNSSKSATGNCLFLPDRLYENGHNFFVRTPNESKATSQQHDCKNAELSQPEDFKNPELKGEGKHLKTHNACLNTSAGTSKQITYQDKATQTEKKNTIEEILKTITTLCIKVDSMDNEIQKLKTNEAPAKILYEEIKPPIQVIKIGLTKDMIIPDDIGQQEEIQKIEIPSFYANKRIIGISTIIQELANNYLNGNAIWSYYSRDQLMIYSNSRELKKIDMDEVQRWILSLLKPEERPTTRALKAGFISSELLIRYCKLIGHKYPDHICSKCVGEDNITQDVQLE